MSGLIGRPPPHTVTGQQQRMLAKASALRQVSLGEVRTSSTSELSAIGNSTHTVQLYSSDNMLPRWAHGRSNMATSIP